MQLIQREQHQQQYYHHKPKPSSSSKQMAVVVAPRVTAPETAKASNNSPPVSPSTPVKKRQDYKHHSSMMNIRPSILSTPLYPSFGGNATEKLPGLEYTTTNAAFSSVLSMFFQDLKHGNNAVTIEIVSDNPKPLQSQRDDAVLFNANRKKEDKKNIRWVDNSTTMMIPSSSTSLKGGSSSLHKSRSDSDIRSNRQQRNGGLRNRPSTSSLVCPKRQMSLDESSHSTDNNNKNKNPKKGRNLNKELAQLRAKIEEEQAILKSMTTMKQTQERGTSSSSSVSASSTLFSRSQYQQKVEEQRKPRFFSIATVVDPEQLKEREEDDDDDDEFSVSIGVDDDSTTDGNDTLLDYDYDHLLGDDEHHDKFDVVMNHQQNDTNRSELAIPDYKMQVNALADRYAATASNRRYSAPVPHCHLVVPQAAAAAAAGRPHRASTGTMDMPVSMPKRRESVEVSTSTSMAFAAALATLATLDELMEDHQLP
jgi:hypothetical protein